MQESPNKMQFGWEGDDGLGERLIRKIMNGEKTATCAPIFDFTPEELEEAFKNKGKVVIVVDQYNKPWCKVEMLDVFKTTFGNPDSRLLKGEGYKNDLVGFQKTHREVWADWLLENNFLLDDETILVVEQFRLIEV